MKANTPGQIPHTNPNGGPRAQPCRLHGNSNLGAVASRGSGWPQDPKSWRVFPKGSKDVAELWRDAPQQGKYGAHPFDVAGRKPMSIGSDPRQKADRNTPKGPLQIGSSCGGTLPPWA
uniref:Uncharacterized protein n=1 Tax=Eutreptiella gymnastica TaxID=73025 RepID=A0A7S4CGA0_9EUGL